MTRSTRAAIGASILAAAVVAAGSRPALSAGAVGSASGVSGPHRSTPAEVARLRAHFDSVDAELRAADVITLSPVQRARRAGHIARLRRYRDTGRFPHNHHVAGRIPVFVDEHGTHCAIGYLIAESGRADIVERVRRDRNLAHIPELADDTALVRWLDDNGLTIAEAARIQPQYDGGGLIIGDEAAEAPVRPEQWAVSGGAGLVGLTSMFQATASRPSRGWALAGLGAGVAGIAVAASHLGDQGESGAFGGVNMLLGAAGVLVNAFAYHRATAAAPPGPVAEAARDARRWSMAVAPGLDAERRLAAAAAVRLRF
ncbi:MAG TPA: hypothetical protein VNA89_12595 [Gemmatimonadaceae bacterium]|nr:hypothetical protein [Gemmatimonadaceae bacterium]